jgi:outer membrane immunogenic protein
MRKRLLSAVAMATWLAMDGTAHSADLYVAPPAPVFDWSGVYIGAAGGWGVDDQVNFRIREEPFFHDEHELSGAVFGGQLGARYMWSTGGTLNVVGGAELQGFATDISGDNEVNLLGGPYAPKIHTDTDIDSLLLAKLKLGFSIDRVWLYGTVGWASADISPSASLKLEDIYVPVQSCVERCGGRSAKFTWADDRRTSGVVFGAGVNWAVTDQIVVGAEWNHIDIQDTDFSAPVKFQGEKLFPVHAHSDFGTDVVMGTISWNWGGTTQPMQ